MLFVLKTLLVLRILKTKFIYTLIQKPIFKEKDNRKTGNSEVFFILGCGSSINELSAEQIEIINRSESVGINLFIMHEKLKPTYYSIEVADIGDEGKVNNSQLLSNLVIKKSSKNKNLKFIISYDNWPTVKRMIPNILNFGEINFIYPVGIPGRSIKNFLNLHEFIFSKFINKLLSKKIIFSKNASVIALVYFAIFRGYKNIVLCGVDLTSEYFWEGKTGAFDYPAGKNFINMQKSFGSRHKTDTTSLPVSMILSAINDSNCETKLWVSSSSSRLSNKLPVFSFEVNS